MTSIWHWFLNVSGSHIPPSGSQWYNWWSGPGSDLGEASILLGILAAYRHHNCHVKGCPRLGRTVDGTPYLACPRHHPAHHGERRGVSLSNIHEAHHAAKETT